MKKSEVGQLLTAIAATDNRTTGMLDVNTWAAILPEDLQLTDALAAVIAHRRTSTEWLMPKHIIDAASAVRRQRLTDAGDPPMPGGLAYDQEKAWRRLWCGHVKDGLDRKAAAVAASLDMNLPAEIEQPPVERLAEITAWGQRKSIPGRAAHCNEKHPEEQLLCGLPPHHKANEHYSQGVAWSTAS